MYKTMAVKISYLFIWFSVYLRYNVIGVINMYIYDKVYDKELFKNDKLHMHPYGGA